MFVHMKYLLLTAVVMSLFACSQPENESVRDTAEAQNGVVRINGVERSELALTMRLMYDQMKLVRDSLKQGIPVKTNYLKRFESIHSDRATEPEKIDEVYRSMADHFLKSYERFESAPDTAKVKSFNSMIDACLACHQGKCPGPMQTIGKLKIK